MAASSASASAATVSPTASTARRCRNSRALTGRKLARPALPTESLIASPDSLADRGTRPHRAGPIGNAERRDQAVEARGGRRRLLDQRHPDIGAAGIFAGFVGPRHVRARQHLEAGLGP